MQSSAKTTYRLPADARIGRVVLRVADLERSIDYYGLVIGLALLRREGDRAELGVEDTDTVLVELRAVPESRPVGPHGHLGLFHFAVLLPTRTDLGRFVRHAHSLGEHLGAADHGVSEALYLTDPDGHGVEVYADRPSSAWKHVNGEVLMSTDSLDIANLVKLGVDRAWAGAPEGTTIGHVHLRVANIAQAEAFYHELLGFDRTVWSYPGALFMSAGGYHHHLAVNTWSPGAVAPGPDDARLLQWELVVPADDAATVLANMRESGSVLPAGTDGGIVLDPWGTAVRIVAED